MLMEFEFSEVLPNEFEYMDSSYSYIAVDPASAIAQGIGMASQGAGMIAQASAEKSKSVPEIAKEIQARCGRKPLSKKRLPDYQKCSSDVQLKYDSDVAKKNEVELQLKLSAIKQRNMLYIGIGLFLAVGTFLYFRNKKK